MLSSVNKILVAAANFFVALTKNLSVIPNFVAVTKPVFSVFFISALDVLYGRNFESPSQCPFFKSSMTALRKQE